MSLWRRPVHPVPWNDAMRGLKLYSEISAPEPVVRLTLDCACRAFYGNYFKAAWALFVHGIENERIRVVVGVRCWWYKVRGLSEHEVEQRWRRG